MRHARLPRLLLALVPTALLGGEPAPARPPSGGAWNAGTSPRETAPAQPLAPLGLTVYPGFNNLHGGPRNQDPPLAVDVTSVMTRCPDGNVIVTALVIGGQLNPLDNRCPDSRAAPSRAPAGPTPAIPACDAATWNCSTGRAPR